MWQEHLSEEETPPEWMWHLEHELEPWFENVKQQRDDKSGRSDDREQVPMMDNEYARGRR
jgi:hypothetical protein